MGQPPQICRRRVDVAYRLQLMLCRLNCHFLKYLCAQFLTRQDRRRVCRYDGHVASIKIYQLGFTAISGLVNFDPDRNAEALNAYKSMRHRRRERGEAKAAILQEQEAAEEALTRANRTLEVTLEEARRSGVPPGWIREAMEDPPAASERN